jgi:hypothetical protein
MAPVRKHRNESYLNQKNYSMMELKIITNLNIEFLFLLQAAGEAKETESKSWKNTRLE